jgi:hypothetical protein
MQAAGACQKLGLTLLPRRVHANASNVLKRKMPDMTLSSFPALWARSRYKSVPKAAVYKILTSAMTQQRTLMQAI